MQCASQRTVLGNSPLFEYSYDFQFSANITLTHKLLEMHGWMVSTAAADALVVRHSVEYVSSYASKQLQNWYNCEK